MQGLTAAGLFLTYLVLIVAGRPYVRPIENVLIAFVAVVSLATALLNVLAPNLPHSVRLAMSIGECEDPFILFFSFGFYFESLN
jgi:hypothetical protein